jgi:MFS family permease
MDNALGQPTSARLRTGRRRTLIGGTVVLAVGLILIGFATPALRPRDSTLDRPERRYSDDLRVCRFLQGGPAAQRNRLKPSSPYIAGCLRRRGWSADGAPTLESILGRDS